MSDYRATEAVVDFVLGYELGHEDEPTLERARLLVLDLLGVGFAGARSGLGRLGPLARSVALADGGATVIGREERCRGRDAALVNGYAAHLLEFDDATLNPVGHPSVTILPALFGLAEERGIGGREMLTAYLVGLEVHSRLGQAGGSNWSHLDSWLPLGHIGLLGAAAACARLLSLDRSRTAWCLGLAAHFAGQLNVNNGSLAKSLGAGHSARCAVQAAELAEMGITGATDSIEAPGGFADTFLKVDAESLREALAHLGEPSHLQEIGVAVKRYPSCYGSHWSIDALRSLLDDGIAADEVKRVELAYPDDAAFMDRPRPHDPESARFSFQYCLAACLVDGYPAPATFADDRIGSEEMKEALALIEARPHPAGLEPPARWSHLVTVETKNGERRACSVKRPRGHPRNPLDAGEVVEKFLAGTRSLGGDRAWEIVAAVEDLDSCEDIGRLLVLLGGVEK